MIIRLLPMRNCALAVYLCICYSPMVPNKGAGPRPKVWRLVTWLIVSERRKINLYLYLYFLQSCENWVVGFYLDLNQHIIIPKWLHRLTVDGSQIDIYGPNDSHADINDCSHNHTKIWHLTDGTINGWSGPDVIVMQLLLWTDCSLVRFTQQNLVRKQKEITVCVKLSNLCDVM